MRRDREQELFASSQTASSLAEAAKIRAELGKAVEETKKAEAKEVITEGDGFKLVGSKKTRK